MFHALRKVPYYKDIVLLMTSKILKLNDSLEIQK